MSEHPPLTSSRDYKAGWYDATSGRDMTECVCGAALGSAEPKPKPKWADLFGIDPDYCGGKDVNEWLDEQRGEA